MPALVKPAPLAGVLVLTPSAAPRADGSRLVWGTETLRAAGVDPVPAFVQDNQSVSARAGTLRGLHYQAPPMAQAKLVRCIRGAILDVAVDARRSSPTYGHWASVRLSAANRRQIWIPPGFLHGFLTLEDETEVLYRCSARYDHGLEGAVRWDSLGIDWPLDAHPVLSQKDAAAPAFADWHSPFI